MLRASKWFLVAIGAVVVIAIIALVLFVLGISTGVIDPGSFDWTHSWHS